MATGTTIPLPVCQRIGILLAAVWCQSRGNTSRVLCVLLPLLDEGQASRSRAGFLCCRRFLLRTGLLVRRMKMMTAPARAQSRARGTAPCRSGVVGSCLFMARQDGSLDQPADISRPKCRECDGGKQNQSLPNHQTDKRVVLLS